MECVYRSVEGSLFTAMINPLLHLNLIHHYFGIDLGAMDHLVPIYQGALHLQGVRTFTDMAPHKNTYRWQ